MQDYIAAHKFCGNHITELKQDTMCGCFYCGKIFNPAEITEWIDEGRTALCPYCGIDSIIGASSGFLINDDFLKKMNQYWFG